MEDRRRSEIIVGIFILIAVGIVMFLIVRMGGALFVRRYEVTAYFKNAAGLTAGVPVSLAGVPIGTVDTVKLLTPKQVHELNKTGTLVKVALMIDYEYGIPQDSKLVLSRTALLGEPSLTFTPTNTMQYLPKDGNAVVWATEVAPAPSEQVSTLFEGLKAEFSTLLNNVNDIIGDPKFKASLKSTITNLAAITEQGPALTADVRKTLDNLNGLLTDAQKDLNNVSAEIAKLAKEGQETARSTADTAAALQLFFTTAQGFLSRMGADIEQQKGLLGSLLKDKQLDQNVKQVVQNLNSSLTEIKAAAARGAAAADQLRQLADFIRKHPSALLFGGQGGPQKNYTPPPIPQQ